MHQVSSRRLELSIVHRLLPAFEVVIFPLSFSGCCSHRCGTSLPPSNLGGCSFRFWKAFSFLPSAFGLFCYIHKRNKAFYSSMTWKMMGSKLYFQHITVPLAVWTWLLAEYFWIQTLIRAVRSLLSNLSRGKCVPLCLFLFSSSLQLFRKWAVQWYHDLNEMVFRLFDYRGKIDSSSQQD